MGELYSLFLSLSFLALTKEDRRNGEFEMTTASSNNSFIRNGELYILPTLTSDVIGREGIFDGQTFNLTGCTNTNLTACGAVSNATSGTVINPVMSARISTKGKRSIRYGKVEVRAKLPRG
jgi:beta-glucanase (GH16 family)